MGTWSISPNDTATINNNGYAIFQPNKGNEDMVYTITYTNDKGNSITATHTVRASSDCQCNCGVYPNGIFLPSEGSEDRITIGTYYSSNCDGEWNVSYLSGNTDFLYDFEFYNGSIMAKVLKNTSEKERRATYKFSIGNCESTMTSDQDAACKPSIYGILIEDYNADIEHHEENITYFLTDATCTNINQQTENESKSHSVEELIESLGTKIVSCESNQVIEWTYECTYNIPGNKIDNWTTAPCVMGNTYNLFSMSSQKTSISEKTFVYTLVGNITLRDKEESDNFQGDSYIEIKKLINIKS